MQQPAVAGRLHDLVTVLTQIGGKRCLTVDVFPADPAGSVVSCYLCPIKGKSVEELLKVVSDSLGQLGSMGYAPLQIPSVWTLGFTDGSTCNYVYVLLRWGLPELSPVPG